MTLPADLPADFAPPRVRAADRLGFTLFVAALLHLALILGVSFSFAKPGEIRRTMEITLATFKSEVAPKKADFLAQENQQGAGTLDKAEVPKTTEVAPFQDTKVNKVTPPPVSRKVEVPPPPTKAAAVSYTHLTLPTKRIV